MSFIAFSTGRVIVAIISSPGIAPLSIRITTRGISVCGNTDDGIVKPAKAPARQSATVTNKIGLPKRGGVAASFLLFYLAEQVYKLDRDTIQSLIYLKLSVAGHMTVFVTRTRGPFWSIRPAKTLLAAVIGTQIVDTLIAVYGIFMAPIGWEFAALVWVYACAWFLLNDRIRLFAYRVLIPRKRRLQGLQNDARAPGALAGGWAFLRSHAHPIFEAKPKRKGCKDDDRCLITH